MEDDKGITADCKGQKKGDIVLLAWKGNVGQVYCLG